jgi:hypothetical protein
MSRQCRPMELPRWPRLEPTSAKSRTAEEGGGHAAGRELDPSGAVQVDAEHPTRNRKMAVRIESRLQVSWFSTCTAARWIAGD